MTPEPDRGEELRNALARSLDGYVPSPAPVDRILAAGRTRRARRRVAVLATAAVLAAGLFVSLSRFVADGQPPTERQPPATPSLPAPATTPPPVLPLTAGVGRGTVDGQAWTVRLEFYATPPKGFDTAPVPDLPTTPAASSLLCQRMVIGGVRIDHQGGPWADCRAVDGAHDPAASGSMGLWGLHDKGTAGFRLFVSLPGTGVAYGVMTFTDGTTTTASLRTVPGTGYGAWAVAIRDGRTIAVIDEYDAHHHRVSHSTDWR
jgi:hypothetical protein